MQTDKIRLYIVAKQLNVDSKSLVEICQELGYEVKNQLSTIDAEQVVRVAERIKQGSKPAAPPPPPPPAVLPKTITTKVQNLSGRPPVKSKSVDAAPEPAPVAVQPPAAPAVEAPTAAAAAPPVQTEAVPAAVAPPATPAVAPTPAPPPSVSPPSMRVIPNLSSRPSGTSARPTMPAAPPPAAKPAAAVNPPAAPPPAPKPAAAVNPPAAPKPAAAVTPPAAPPPAAKPIASAPNIAATARPPASSVPARPQTSPPNLGAVPGRPSPSGVRNLGAARPDAGGPSDPGGRPPLPSVRIRPRTPGQFSYSTRQGTPPSLRPAGPAGTPAPAQKPKDQPGVLKKIAEIPKELLERGRDVTVDQVIRANQAGQLAPTNLVPPIPSEDTAEGGENDRKKGHRPGSVGGRDIRRAQRATRDTGKTTPAQVQLEGGRVTVLEETRHRGSRLRHKAKPKQPGTQPRKGKVQIDLPISVRGLSEAIGLAVPKLIIKLTQLGMPLGSVTINSYLEPEVAELIAVENGCELEIRKAQTAEDKLIASHDEPDDPELLQPRAPIVTIMGHVDHGKTSLLDRIRQSNVADTEAGGITQVIRAWQVIHNGQPITFLDTPGHEAFTKMRARGAQVTDIAVIVVAADDGVMPQTEEAISHAKAAGVSIVVAINKVDLPNANVQKARQQLYSLNVLPDDMGGDVPFVETSAAKGKGIEELLEAILIVAELKELKANPDKPGRGSCLEAHLRGDEGVFATVLVKEGTLHRGDIVLCGHTYGRVRAMYNDLGRSITEAGPCVPVRITGLNDVPNADDPFLVVDDIAVAREIAEKRAARLAEEAKARFVPMTLDRLGEAKITELKVILKADFRGSVEAIRKELEKLTHEEVRVRVLHAAVGGITVSDVQLAMTSPTDSMIVGFNAVPDDEALALAEQNGIPIREYSIIYNLTDDIKAALEGKLKPREDIIHLGRAVVRDLFRISKVGVVAGCHVTQGTIERSAKVRVIRDGVVVYPPADRTVGLESLKHHKDDVKEVKQGYDCGIKVAGYNDVKVGDVIEAYRVEQVQRTL